MPDKGHLFGHIADFAVIILVGSFIHAGLQHKYAKSMDRTFTYLDFILSLAIGGFTGVMGGLAAPIIGIHDERAQLFVVGVCAVMGLKSMNMLFDALGDYIVKLRSK